tara:strand:+ start:3661 stop:5472 length:1812 start_codon:yes stop_codon:yes gene_type:complete
MPRRNTWKSDKRANDHSSVLSNSVGKKIEVVNTRAKDRGVDGVIAPEGHRFVRRSNESFETTLTTAMRGKSEIDFTFAREVLHDAMDIYRRKWKDYNDAKRESGLPSYEPVKILHATQHAKHASTDLHQYLDTLRCATKANEFFFRSDCVDNAVDNIIKSIKIACARMDADPLGQKVYYFMSMLFGTVVPTPKWHKDVVDVAIKWTRATYDMIDSGNAKDCVNVSIGIAIDLMHLITPKDAPPPPPPSDDPPEDPSDEESDGQSDVDGNPSDDADSNPSEDEIDESLKDESEPTEPDTGSTDVNQSGDIQDSGSNPSEPFDVDTELEALLNKAEEDTQTKLQASESFASDDVQTFDRSDDGVKHETTIRTYKMEPMTADANVVNLLQDTTRMGMAHRHRTGMPTTDTWKISALGDTKVFGRSDHRSGKLVILFDLSGSMDFYSSKEVGSKSYLAVQSGLALQEAFPQAETYGFVSDNKTNYIVPMETGMFPTAKSYHDGMGHGNPDCVALLYLEELLQGQMQDSMAIVISDGYPCGPAPMRDSHMVSHTRQIANRLYNDGLRFASVLINTGSTIYPSDVVAHVRRIEDIYNIGDVIHRVGQQF